MQYGKPTITQEQKDRWLADLRSGEYKKGIGRLRRYTTEGTCYCALGVLALQLENYTFEEDGTNLIDSTGSYKGYRPFDDLFGDYNITFEIHYKSDRHNTFDEVADYIEKYIKVA